MVPEAITVTFQSSDSRPPFARLLWGLCGLALVLLGFMCVSLPSGSMFPTTFLALVCLALAWVCFGHAQPRSAGYTLTHDRMYARWNGWEVFSVPYTDIEYVGYTAENSFYDGARYLPFAGGILCLSTKPGFMITVDFRRRLSVKPTVLFHAPAKRVLLTVDEPKQMISALRSRVG